MHDHFTSGLQKLWAHGMHFKVRAEESSVKPKKNVCYSCLFVFYR